MNSLINFITKTLATSCVSEGGLCKCRCSVCECFLDAHDSEDNDDLSTTSEATTLLVSQHPQHISGLLGTQEQSARQKQSQ